MKFRIEIQELYHAKSEGVRWKQNLHITVVMKIIRDIEVESTNKLENQV